MGVHQTVRDCKVGSFRSFLVVTSPFMSKRHKMFKCRFKNLSELLRDQHDYTKGGSLY